MPKQKYPRMRKKTVELPTGIEKTKSITNSTKDTKDESNKLNKKGFREMKMLESWFIPQVTRAVEDYIYGKELTFDEVILELFSADFIKEPTNYEQALNYGRKEDQIKWKDAIDKG
jgi:hypothetical protein